MISNESCLILYDFHFRIVWLSYTPSPYRFDEVKGRHSWEFMPESAARQFQAATARCLAGLRPETLDVPVENAGRWRVTMWPTPELPVIRLIALCRPFPHGLDSLTDREVELCGLMSKGHSPKEIARMLGRSRSTIDNHRTHIARKLGIQTEALSAWSGAHAEWFADEMS